MSPLVAAYRLADPEWAEDLLARLRPELLGALARDPCLPPAITRYVLERNDADEVRALARNPHLPRDVPFALAALGRPDLGVELYTAGFDALAVSARYESVTWSVADDPEGLVQYPCTADILALRLAVLAAADPADARWYEPGGLVATLLDTYSDARLVPLLRSPFPVLTAHALRVLWNVLPPAVAADARRRLASCGDDPASDDFEAWLERVVPAAHSQPLSDEPPLDEAAFAARVLLVGLRHHDVKVAREDRYADDTDEPWNRDFAEHARRVFPGAFGGGALDWSLIRAEHARIPFTGRGFAVLTSRADCPPDLADLAYREVPNAVLVFAAIPVLVELGVELLRMPGVTGDALRARVAAAGGGAAASGAEVARGPRQEQPDRTQLPSASEVLVIAETVTPAARAVSGILRAAAESPDFAHDPAACALIHRIRAQLDSADAWVVGIRLLRDFPGTLLELLDVAACSATR